MSMGGEVRSQKQGGWALEIPRVLEGDAQIPTAIIVYSRPAPAKGHNRHDLVLSGRRSRVGLRTGKESMVPVAAPPSGPSRRLLPEKVLESQNQAPRGFIGQGGELVLE